MINVDIYFYNIDPQEKHRSLYHKIIANRSKCPTRRWCNKLYYKILFKNFVVRYESPTDTKMIKSLKKYKTYNMKCRQCCAIMSQGNNDLTIAICSPIIKRVHKYLKNFLKYGSKIISKFFCYFVSRFLLVYH